MIDGKFVIRKYGVKSRPFYWDFVTGGEVAFTSVVSFKTKDEAVDHLTKTPSCTKNTNAR